MAKQPRSEQVTMTQSVPEIGPRGVATPAEIAWGHAKRAECGTPARMREVARTLLGIGPGSRVRLTASEAEQAELAGQVLQREADRWDAEGLIDCT